MKTFILFLSIALISMASCKKACYSEALFQANRDKFCTDDCPGVRGCDGKTYCNACEAARKGISVE